MQIIHDFKIGIKEYARKGKDNEAPIVSKCSNCGDLMIKHGFYTRFVITGFNTYTIVIQRYKCKHCNQTVSILPSFLIPNFQRSLNDIVNSIKEYLQNKKYILGKRQVHFYCQRFHNNLPAFISFFRDSIKSNLSFRGAKNKKATKLLEMILDSPVTTFSQRFFNHFNLSFMAL